MRLSRREAKAFGLHVETRKRTKQYREDRSGIDWELWGLPKPVAEYCFALPDREWAFDFAWTHHQPPFVSVALEIEGGSWTGGRHVRGEGFEEDCRKYSEAAIRGWRVIRATTGMVESGEAFELVRRALGLERGVVGIK